MWSVVGRTCVAAANGGSALLSIHRWSSTTSNSASSSSSPPAPLEGSGTVSATSANSTTSVSRAQERRLPVPGASPGGVDYSKRLQERADQALWRQKHVQRATDAERRGEVQMPAKPNSETERWWPPENQNWSGRMFASSTDKNKKKYDGMYVPEMKEVLSQDKPLELSYADDNFFVHPEFHMTDEAHEAERRFLPPPTFDPAIDEIDDDGFVDGQVMFDIQKAVEDDKKRLEAFGNPLLVEDQVDYLLAPQRDGQENMQQRQEFNGFVHWGLLHGAHMILEENQDIKRAHEFVNRYMRDVDLFQKWLEHPKVKAHIQKKFGVDMTAKFDKLMALTMAMYTRSKIQVYEDDPGGALKSLTACMGFINEGANLKLERHRKAIGAVLVARGMVYCKLESYQRADDDLTRAEAFVNTRRSATLYQLRAEAREALGRLEEARLDEERAADIWENAEVVTPGMEDKPMKFVI